MKALNTDSNFIEFNQEIRKNYGELYTSQVDLFFERAMLNAQKGLYLSAIENCKFALSLNEFASEKINIHYLIGYIAQLYCDLGQIDKSWYYYEYGFSLLDDSQENYINDFRLYTNLREHIDLSSWKVA